MEDVRPQCTSTVLLGGGETRPCCLEPGHPGRHEHIFKNGAEQAILIHWYTEGKEDELYRHDRRRKDPLTIEEAVHRITDEMRADKTEGSYYHSWQANIAMAFVDEASTTTSPEDLSSNTHSVANAAAKRFLDQLCHVPATEIGADTMKQPVPNESYAAPGVRPETQTESVRIFAHCRTCRRDYGVNVPVRDPEGDVVTWVNAAATIAGAFHSYTSPKCLSRHLDFAIPVDGVNAVGAAAVPTSVPDQAPSFLKESPSGAEAEFEDEIVLPTDDELARSAPNAGTPIADDDTPPADKAAI
jgi:hypothetical protein